MGEQAIAPQALTERDKGDKLSRISLGMDVFDRLGRRVGKVDDLFGGSHDQQPESPMAVSGASLEPKGGADEKPLARGQRVPEFDAVLGHSDEMPVEVRGRLMHDGFVRINAGLFHRHRYALAGQIAEVAGNRVTLIPVADDLLKY